MTSGFAFNQDFDSDGEETTQHVSPGRDACVFVVDCNETMFEEFDDDGESTNLFRKCLSVLERLLLNRIISNSKDLLGVLLYNTKVSPNPSGIFEMDNPLVVPKSCAILIPMMQIESDLIRFVKNMKISDDLIDFDNKFGHSKDANISDILWACSSMFSSSGKQIRPQIMWLTNEDQPHQVGSIDHIQAFQKAKDLQQLKVDIQFHPMKMEFDGDLFYKELLCQLSGYDIEEFQFPTPQLDERILLQRMFCRGHQKHALAHLTVEFSSKAKFGVGVYGFTRKTVYPKPISLSRSGGDQINVKRSYKFGTIQEDDGGSVDVVSNLEAEFDYSEKLEPSKTVKYFHCGGENIRFTQLEAYEIKQVMDPMIKVLGFKPRSVLNEHNHVRPPYFVYPNDNRVKNSTVFFRALWERCLADDKIIICTCTMRLKSNPRLVALVPSVQEHGTDGEILRYDGFRMEFIPFAGDVRDLSELFKPAPPIDEDVSTNMKRIIGKLRVNYNPTMFPNPIIRQIYTKIEEEEFNELPDEEMNVDSTLPNVDAQDGRIGDYVENLLGLYEGFDEPAVKRKASSASSAPKPKKIAEDIDYELVLQKVLQGDIKSLTVPVLRAYLKSIDVTGISTLTKAQCIDKIKSSVK